MRVDTFVNHVVRHVVVVVCTVYVAAIVFLLACRGAQSPTAGLPSSLGFGSRARGLPLACGVGDVVGVPALCSKRAQASTHGLSAWRLRCAWAWGGQPGPSLGPFPVGFQSSLPIGVVDVLDAALVLIVWT